LLLFHLEAPLIAAELGLFCVQLVFAVAEFVFSAGEHFALAADVFPVLVAGLEGFGGRGEEAVGGVLLNEFEGLLEEEPGAAGVEVVGGDALEYEADGELDGGAVLGDGEVEGGEAGLAGGRIGDGMAGGVVVVAEVLVTEGGGGAAASVDEDVAAALAFGLFDDGLVWHGPLLVFA
jgi:hypothetical protein